MKFKPINRRAFLKHIIRTGVLGGLVSLGIILGKRSSNNADMGKCPVNSSCTTCSQRSGCNKCR